MVGTCCPVWCESRYLPLILAQMDLCPGPKVVLWQDKPLYWFGTGEAPSGFNSDVGRCLSWFPRIEVVQLHKASTNPEAPFGGFVELAKLAFSWLKQRGVTTVVWFDSDYIFSVADTIKLYEEADKNDRPPLLAVKARHYWRDFKHTMSTGDVSLVRPVDDPDLWRHYDESDIQRLPLTMYHPAYVMSDEEMYRKVNSWGHAPLFAERRFYENEWIGGDESKVGPQPADIQPSADVMFRLKSWGALL